MGFPIIAGIMVGSGILNAMAGSSQAAEINRRIAQAQALAAQGLISQEQLAQHLQSINRRFNQRLTSVLNTTAMRTRGFANQGTIGAAAAGGVEAARLGAQENAVNQAIGINSRIRTLQSQYELGTAVSSPISDFMKGAASGFSAGNEVSKLIDGSSPATSSTSTGTGENDALNPGSYQSSTQSFNPSAGPLGVKSNNTLSFGQSTLNTNTPNPSDFDFLQNIRRSLF